MWAVNVVREIMAASMKIYIVMAVLATALLETSDVSNIKLHLQTNILTE
jgi:hypothetical protein